MRAVCEHCERVQPVDWRPGDLCAHCGQSVRREVRCGWCAVWTPAATYCRDCGAEVVAEQLYGAARMLKDAGVDRFTIPKQLTELPAEQIDNFTRIYQRHAVVVARHVEQVAFLQRYLRHQHWAAELEDRLIPQLPWPDEELRRCSTPTVELRSAGRDEELAAIRAIAAATPFAAIRDLSAIARLRLDDRSAVADARQAMASSDATVRDEAALALSSWRTLLMVGPPDDRYALIAELQVSDFPLAAAVRLAALSSDPVELPPDALTSADPETSLGAAIATGAVDRLEAALHGDDLERSAAAMCLVRLGITSRLGPVLEDGPDEVRSFVLDEIARARVAVPDLSDVVLGIIETTPDARLRNTATRVVAPSINGAQAIRVVRASEGDPRVLQTLLQRGELQPEAMAALLDELIARGWFSMEQFGMSTIAENGHLADTFVPARFGAASPDVQRELLRLAEAQLAARGDEALHRFLIGVVFGPLPGEMRTTVWWALHRWYSSTGEFRGAGPFRLDVPAVTRFFGTVDAFLPRLTDVVGDLDALNEVTFADFAADLFSAADPGFIAEIQSRDAAGRQLLDALIATVQAETRHNTNEAMIVFLSEIATLPAWRADALAALRHVDRAGNYHYDKAVRRLVLAEFGLPTDDAWPALPVDLVPARFGDVSPTGQAFLLDVAEQQLIHADGEPDAALLAFLADTSVNASDEAMRERARMIHEDRSPRPMWQ